jgi:DNA polymerase-3 subunit epsilon
MKLFNMFKTQLEKPIVFFDVETTGLDISEDRIIEICAIKINPDKNKERFYSLINPEGKEISEGAQEKHQILPSDLEDEPTFKELADDILAFFKDCDLGGYNVGKFDIPMLNEEFLRCGKFFDVRNSKIIDPYVIVTKKEPRTLEGVYKHYTGKEMENAHKAEVDINATIEVFEKQTELYEDLDNIQDIHKFSFGDRVVLDLSGKFKYDSETKNIKFNFGKWNGKTIEEVFRADKNYFHWIIEKSKMTRDTKLVASKLLKKLQNTN